MAIPATPKNKFPLQFPLLSIKSPIQLPTQFSLQFSGQFSRQFSGQFSRQISGQFSLQFSGQLCPFLLEGKKRWDAPRHPDCALAPPLPPRLCVLCVVTAHVVSQMRSQNKRRILFKIRKKIFKIGPKRPISLCYRMHHEIS